MDSVSHFISRYVISHRLTSCWYSLCHTWGTLKWVISTTWEKKECEPQTTQSVAWLVSKKNCTVSIVRNSGQMRQIFKLLWSNTQGRLKLSFALCALVLTFCGPTWHCCWIQEFSSILLRSTISMGTDLRYPNRLKGLHLHTTLESSFMWKPPPSTFKLQQRQVFLKLHWVGPPWPWASSFTSISSFSAAAWLWYAVVVVSLCATSHLSKLQNHELRLLSQRTLKLDADCNLV